MTTFTKPTLSSILTASFGAYKTTYPEDQLLSLAFFSACSPVQYRPTASSETFTVHGYTDSGVEMYYKDVKTKAASAK